MIVCFIDTYRNRFGVEPICAVLTQHGIGIAPSTYYARSQGPSEADLCDAYVANIVYDVWKTSRCFYGVRKLFHALKHQGVHLGRDQVGRLMKILGIEGIRRGKKHVTMVSEPLNERFPDHVKRRWDYPVSPDTWWVADFTYVRTGAGFSYVAFITDVYSRRILGWAVQATKTETLVEVALNHAVAGRRRECPGFDAVGIIHHSDAGSQYTAGDFAKVLEKEGITRLETRSITH